MQASNLARAHQFHKELQQIVTERYRQPRTREPNG